MFSFQGKRKKNSWNREINPDEIFLDSKNLPQFNTQQFEGRIEKPIERVAVVILGLFFLLVSFIFIGRVWFLQVAKGEEYKERSENNRLEHTPIFSVRGIIYDRNNIELAWNSLGDDGTFSTRSYIPVDGFAHVLGHVSYPQKDKGGFYYQENFIGKEGIEKIYNDSLTGKNGIRLIEVDALGNVQSENTIAPPVDGSDVTLTIDSRLQEMLHTFIKQTASERGFLGGGGVVMDVLTGEILALTSYPEYSPSILSDGSNREVISRYVTDERKPFLNRVVSGLYTPGSIVKPYVAMGALSEHVIDPNKKILSTGSISIQNPYYPDLKTVFMDWKAHGWVNMREAIGVSSNVYFYVVGGGYEDQKGIGISNIEKYARMFGLGAKTGVDVFGEVDGLIPNPEWKAETFDGEAWRIGDTYNTAIGQYGFQVTPIQMVRAVAALANGGSLVTPHLYKSEQPLEPIVIPLEESNFQIVREGMRNVVKGGTGSALDIPSVAVAAKTGTAELGTSKKFVNSWTTGFFPYENPRYAFAVVMERGSRENLVGASAVMRNFFDWMTLHTPEYIK